MIISRARCKKYQLVDPFRYLCFHCQMHELIRMYEEETMYDASPIDIDEFMTARLVMGYRWVISLSMITLMPTALYPMLVQSTVAPASDKLTMALYSWIDIDCCCSFYFFSIEMQVWWHSVLDQCLPLIIGKECSKHVTFTSSRHVPLLFSLCRALPLHKREVQKRTLYL